MVRRGAGAPRARHQPGGDDSLRRIRTALQERRSIAPGRALAYVLGIGSALVALAMAVMLARTLGR